MKSADGPETEPQVIVRRWVSEPPGAGTEQALQRLAAHPDVRRLAVMPDVHEAGEVCNGVVLATTATLLPQAVGGDIGCGMAALAFRAEGGLVRDEGRAAALLGALYRVIPALMHRPGTPAGETELLELSAPELQAVERREGRLQMGTLGRGNHFLELQHDEEDQLWLMLHSGSRGLGQAVFEHHLRRAQNSAGGLAGLDAASEEGRAYLADHDRLLEYARLNRRTMLERCCEQLQRLFRVEPEEGTLRECHHNFVRQEEHFGELLWVHRKGALSASEGEAGIIPGSMGTVSYHVSGRGCADSLCSSSHGAGRALSRSEARRRIAPRQLEREMGDVLFDRRLARELCEEAPSAYRDIGRVMRAQRELVRIERKLHPLLCFKGA